MIYSNNLFLCEYLVCRLSSGVGTDAYYIYQQTKDKVREVLRGKTIFHF
jgi:hypothetical protein